jgi:hypothetical protein
MLREVSKCATTHRFMTDFSVNGNEGGYFSTLLHLMNLPNKTAPDELSGSVSQ